MEFKYIEKIELLHKIEINTEDEELFEKISEDIAEEMYRGCDDGTEMALRKFREAFGEKNLKFIKDISGRSVEYEAD